MSRSPSVSSKSSQQEENAYASAYDAWTPEDDLKALSGTIKESSDVLDGEEQIEDVAGLASVPVGNGSSRSLRDPGASNLQPSLRSNARYGRGGSPGPEEPWNDEHSATTRSRVSFASNTKGANTTSGVPIKQTKAATRLRAVIALGCLILSLALALLFAHGHTGRWITNQAIGIAPGTTSVKEGPVVQGIPGSIGEAQPTYNGTFEIPDLEAMNIVFSPEMENYGDWRIPFPAANRTDLPVFWQIPKSGGTVLKRILGECLGMVEFSEEGRGHLEPTLQILENSNGLRYLNVDATSVDGLQRAFDLNLAQSGLADVMFTTLIPQTAKIFTIHHRGRLFTVFRDPMERAMATYASAQAQDPTIAGISISEYAINYLPNNEMVRTLSGKAPGDELSDDDLYVAMEILRRKCVVGLVEFMPDSIQRFYGYFGWHALMVQGVADCQTALLAPNLGRIPAPKEGSEAHTSMLNQNRLDLRLYDYARYLFDLQGGNAREAK